ncbi:MAG TPA: HNH endonuclease, partial [Streptosporangiaceae bacterium]
LCVQLDRLRRHGTAPGSGTGTGHDGADVQAAGGGAGTENGPDSGSPEVPAAFGGGLSREALEQAVIGKAVELLSGPGGLASFLRRNLLGARLGGDSVPLDIGYSDTVPASIRNAVRHRALHCEWAGRCDQPAAACQVHHTTHKANGGKTSLTGCVLLCHYHHQVMIHRLGWTLVVNPDGTTTAWNKDKTKVLHSHGPPARAG